MKLSRKLFSFIIVFLLSNSFVFAFSITPGEANSNVDLSNSFGIYSCLGNHESTEPTLSGYDRQIIAKIDLLSGAQDEKITIEFPADMQYEYKKDGITGSSYFPYGIELVYRQKWEIPWYIVALGIFIGGIPDTIETISEYTYLGQYHNGSSGDTSATFNISYEKNMSKDIIKSNFILNSLFLRLFSHFGENQSYDDYLDSLFSEYGVIGSLAEVYIDVVLVLPDDYTDDSLLYAENNEYVSSFTVNDEEIFEFCANYYNINKYIEMSLNVQGNHNAKNINLSDDTIFTADGISVGTYEYTVTEKSNMPEDFVNADSAFYAFLSSSQNSTDTAAEKFTLSNSDASFSFPYEAGIKKGLGSTVWYDGTNHIAAGSSSVDVLNFLVEGNANTGGLFNPSVVSYSDGGSVMFRLDKSEVNVDQIPPGTYTSTIYFHVVANL